MGVVLSHTSADCLIASSYCFRNQTGLFLKGTKKVQAYKQTVQCLLKHPLFMYGWNVCGAWNIFTAILVFLLFSLAFRKHKDVRFLKQYYEAIRQSAEVCQRATPMETQTAIFQIIGL